MYFWLAEIFGIMSLFSLHMLHDPKEETGTSVTQAIVMHEAAHVES